MALENYEEAVRDYEKAHRHDKNNPEYRQALQQAKLELKKSKRKDYYKILGVGKDANEEEIKKAYRKRALVHHPGNFQVHLTVIYSPFIYTHTCIHACTHEVLHRALHKLCVSNAALYYISVL